MRSSYSGAYFDHHESMAAVAGFHDVPHVLDTIAQRYVGQHPAHSPVYRVTRESAIRKLPNHLYDMSASSLFSGMRQGQFVYAWAFCRRSTSIMRQFWRSTASSPKGIAGCKGSMACGIKC
jgi:hypothetical protein